MGTVLAAGSTHGNGKYVGFLVVGILWIVIGGVQVAYPQLGWRMNSWQFKNRNALEPSAAGLTFRRAIAGVIVVAGVALVIFALTKL